MSSSGVGVLKGLLYAVGGHDGPLVRKSCEVYDPASNSWRQVADMNMCRRNAGEKVFSSDILGCEKLLCYTSINLRSVCLSFQVCVL